MQPTDRQCRVCHDFASFLPFQHPARLTSVSPASSKREIESGPFSDRTFRPDLSTMTLDDALYRGKADAVALEFILVMQSLEDPEQLCGLSHIKSNAVVANKICRFPII